jgi:NAD(P)-dependent dehydrogenase (short-subunit alcohol dehydrogenase family)
MGAHFPDVAVSASSTALTTGTRQMMPNDKVAVIYGAGGAIGGAVAQAFARERAKVFLTGRNLAPVEVVAQDIVSARGTAEAAEVDALDEQAVDRHLQAGRVDISFNAVGIPDTKILGVPMVDLGVEQFSRPIATYTTPPTLRLEGDWARSAAAAVLDRIAAEIRAASASQNMKRSSSAWAEAVGWLSSREYLFLLGPTVDHHDPFALDMP